ncbi:MAG: hypothetical protein ACOX3S_03655 [Anaerolineae bacterium]|jgi:hypothetical protein
MWATVVGMGVVGRLAVAGAMLLGLRLCVRAQERRFCRSGRQRAPYGLWQACQPLSGADEQGKARLR